MVGSKQKKVKGKSVSFAPSLSDPRFSALQTDPRYRNPSKKNTTVQLDKRLSAILKDDTFSQKASVDRYGRKLAKGQNKKDLKRLYRLASDDEDEDSDPESEDDDKAVSKELERIEKKYDPARDGGFSASESESDSSDDSEVEDEIDAALPDEMNQVPTGDVSSRLAIVNLDWDNINAQDLMAVASSFVPPEGRIISVAVYPSEFGRERMEREEVEGPPKEIFQSAAKEREAAKEKSIAQLVEKNTLDVGSDDEAGSSEDEQIKKNLLKEDSGAEFDSIALRKYQLDRLRYYYAVVTCSSNEVAKSLYDNMDGQEYISSANFFDMRFIPDEVDFDNDKPREICHKVPDGYKPSDFTTDALMHSNVKLTWDADDNKRKEVQKRAFSRKEIDEQDLLAYIGTDSSEDEDEEEEELIEDDNSDAGVKSTTSRATTREARRDALRAALGLDLEPLPSRKNKKEDRHVGDMQITFTPALSSSKKGESVFENDPKTAFETTAEKYVRKERERKAKRKERAKARRAGELVDDATPTVDPAKAGAEVSDGNPAEDDDPFNDPFFDNPDAEIDNARQARREEKARLRREQEKIEKSKSAQRAELELIMMDDEAADTGNPHFDIKEITKNEVKARKKSKSKKKNKENADDDPAVKDSFTMNVKDPRFAKLFEDPAYAIDPTNPKYRDTKGMRDILTEKRKRGEDRMPEDGHEASTLEKAKRLSKKLKR